MFGSIKVSMNGEAARQKIKALSVAEIRAITTGSVDDAAVFNWKRSEVEEEFANAPVLVGHEAVECLLRYADDRGRIVNQDMIDLVESFPGNSQIVQVMRENIGSTIAFF